MAIRMIENGFDGAELEKPQIAGLRMRLLFDCGGEKMAQFGMFAFERSDESAEIVFWMGSVSAPRKPGDD